MALKAAEDLRHVTAILVVHDGALWLPEVVASLTSQKRFADQILAVDTGSTDSSAAVFAVNNAPTRFSFCKHVC